MHIMYYLGMVAGATGAFIGTPAEISLIRMTSDGRCGSAHHLLYICPFVFLILSIFFMQASS